MTELATFAAGCFWQIEINLRNIEGVLATRVGYTGGHTENPTYEDVCARATGHAEAVEVTFNPAEVSYETLLDAFWKMHDPTQVNRQGPDVGSQYRSAIFYHTEAQQKQAETSKNQFQETLDRPIATEITKADTFWEAEEYHQQYLVKRGMATCRI